jgi:hypothetical protein
MDVLVGKLTAYVDASSRPARSILTPSWVLSLEPVPVSPQAAFRARGSGGIPWFDAIARPGARPAPPDARDLPVRTPAELLAIQLLKRLGASHLHDGSSETDIRSAWRQLLRECHPDAHPHAREAERIVLTARLRAVIRARDVLEAAPSVRLEAA